MSIARRRYAMLSGTTWSYAEQPENSPILGAWSVAAASVDLTDLPPLSLRLCGLVPISQHAEGIRMEESSTASAKTTTLSFDLEQDFCSWVMAFRWAMVTMPTMLRRFVSIACEEDPSWHEALTGQAVGGHVGKVTVRPSTSLTRRFVIPFAAVPDQPVESPRRNVALTAPSVAPTAHVASLVWCASLSVRPSVPVPTGRVVGPFWWPLSGSSDVPLYGYQDAVLRITSETVTVSGGSKAPPPLPTSSSTRAVCHTAIKGTGAMMDCELETDEAGQRPYFRRVNMSVRRRRSSTRTSRSGHGGSSETVLMQEGAANDHRPNHQFTWSMRSVQPLVPSQYGSPAFTSIGGVPLQDVFFLCLCDTHRMAPVVDAGDDTDPIQGGGDDVSAAGAVVAMAVTHRATVCGGGGGGGEASPPSTTMASDWLSLVSTNDHEWRGIALTFLEQGSLLLLTSPGHLAGRRDATLSATSNAKTVAMPGMMRSLSTRRPLAVLFIGCSSVGKSRLVQLLVAEANVAEGGEDTAPSSKAATEAASSATMTTSSAADALLLSLTQLVNDGSSSSTSANKSQPRASVGVGFHDVRWPVAGPLPWTVTLIDAPASSSKPLLKSLASQADLVLGLFDCTDVFSVSWLEQAIPQIGLAGAAQSSSSSVARNTATTAAASSRLLLVGLNGKHPRRVVDALRLANVQKFSSSAMLLLDNSLWSANDPELQRFEKDCLIRDQVIELCLPRLFMPVVDRMGAILGLHGFPVASLFKIANVAREHNKSYGSIDSATAASAVDQNALRLTVNNQEMSAFLTLCGVPPCVACGIFEEVSSFALSFAALVHKHAATAAATQSTPRAVPSTPRGDRPPPSTLHRTTSEGSLRERTRSVVFQFFAASASEGTEQSAVKIRAAAPMTPGAPSKIFTCANQVAAWKAGARVSWLDVIVWLGLSIAIDFDARALAVHEAVTHFSASNDHGASVERHGLPLGGEDLLNAIGTGPARVIQASRLHLVYIACGVDVPVATVTAMLKAMDASQVGFVDGHHFGAFAAHPAQFIIMHVAEGSPKSNARMALAWIGTIVAERLQGVAYLRSCDLGARAELLRRLAVLNDADAASCDAASPATSGDAVTRTGIAVALGNADSAVPVSQTTSATPATGVTAATPVVTQSRSCNRCGADFNLTRSRYKCFNCEEQYCFSCASKEAPFATGGGHIEQRRVCIDCFAMLVGGTSSTTGIGNMSMVSVVSASTTAGGGGTSFPSVALASAVVNGDANVAYPPLNGSAMSHRPGAGVVKWQRDESVKNCTLCDLPFGAFHFRLRHHCRSCGKVVCSACSPRKAMVPGYTDEQRICIACERARRPSFVTAAAKKSATAEGNETIAGSVGSPKPLPTDDASSLAAVASGSLEGAADVASVLLPAAMMKPDVIVTAAELLQQWSSATSAGGDHSGRGDTRTAFRAELLARLAAATSPLMLVKDNEPVVVGYPSLPWYDTYTNRDDVQLAQEFVRTSTKALRHADDALVQYTVLQPGCVPEADDVLEAAIDESLPQYRDLGPELDPDDVDDADLALAAMMVGSSSLPASGS